MDVPHHWVSGSLKLRFGRSSTTHLRAKSQNVRIPTKPAIDSDLKPASHSDFIPAGVPI
ncbi:hypothetical protein [Mesorhizobium sp. M0715]|uniref:hypothetical protein n=1 Tax=Mesorhizobium sp. M0715 TaxID=2956990 RepID=UPI00333A9C01